MIDPLSQIFNLRDNRLLTDITSWLKQTWAFELGFLQSVQENDPTTFYPMSCPTPQTVIDITLFRSNIESGDPGTYNMKNIQRNNNWNQLNMTQLFRHIRIKTDTCPMHNIFEVVLHLLYYDSLLHRFPQFRNPCDGSTPILTPIVVENSNGENTLLVRHNPYPR